ncbi:GmrSD restriction endonuclease domain-containing protein [Mycoplasma sp. CR]|uniref:GmrSD restriction endonuclease domain-containing protein n=1 Tax=unclassified Mycoplasma TaxID=2683645 RepID=UPI003AADFCED
MKTDKRNVLKILSGNDKYIIPIYQRPYSWGNKQLTRLWNDILKIHKFNKKDYFIGAMVAVAETPLPNEINKFVIIDGQQRLTTLIIFLIALRDCYLESNQQEEAEQIQKQYLTISSEGKTYNRIESKKNDQDTLKYLIEGTPFKNKKSLIIDAYRYFKDQIMISNISMSELFEVLSKLWLVPIILEKDNCDAQDIFESLNSTGEVLTALDLIRNFLIMNLPYNKQDEIYENYWEKLEKLFTIDGILDNTAADNFIRDYLTMQTKNIPNKNNLYDEFKNYFYSLNIFDKNIEICKDLYNKANIYVQIYFSKYSGNESISHIFNSIKDLQINITYPFFMQLLDEYQKGTITSDNVILALKLSISFIIRRNVCSLPSNRLNKIFASLWSHINLNKFSESISEYFFSLRDKERFPRDEEFLRDFINFNVYKNMNKRYLLKSLEENDNKNTINIDNATIEHILPQGNLIDEWQNMLGENYDIIQEEYCHRIGNLTLTNYNPEMSNKSFQKKLTMKGGIKLTPYKLNQYFIVNDIQVWNKEEIDKRSSFLAAEAVKIWTFPEVDEDFIVRKKVSYTNIDHFITSPWSREVYEIINNYVQTLDQNVSCHITKKYIAYKINDRAFLSLNLKKSSITIGLHMKIAEVNDSMHICRDVTNIGHNHTGKTEFSYTKKIDLAYAFDLIAQSFNKYKDKNS